MKKRIEKVVECIEYTDALTIGKRYTTYSESVNYYIVMDDEGDAEAYNKENFKVYNCEEQEHGLKGVLDKKLILKSKASLEKGVKSFLNFNILKT